MRWAWEGDARKGRWEGTAGHRDIPSQHCPTHLLHQLLQHLEGGTALAGERDQVGVSRGPGLAALSPELLELLEGVFLVLPYALVLLLALLQVSRDLGPSGCDHLLVKQQIGYWGKFLLRKGGPALEWVVRGSGGSTVPGGAQNPRGCGPWGHGLVVALAVLREQLDLMVLETFPTSTVP